MGVPSEKISDAAAIIRHDAEYIAGQDSFDVYEQAAEDLRIAMLLIADVLLRRESSRRGDE
jgi:hypothetical protein